jgi:carbonic anhydrase
MLFEWQSLQMNKDSNGTNFNSGDFALQRLRAGNLRFLSGDTHVPTLETDLLDQQAKGQQPYATILGCSDSRVPPELIFDAWLGELFVVRVAGNVLGPSILGTLQYAAIHLHTPLFVVMGHEGCGAVHAAISYKFEGMRQADRIEALLENIVPALEGIDPSACEDTQMNIAVEANVRRTVRQLAGSPEGQKQLVNGVKIVGAVYELHTGRVRFLEDAGETEQRTPVKIELSCE